MAGRRLNLTEKKIQDMIKKGCGKGTGSDYIPWLKIGSFASNGRGNRVADENGRVHHMFSDLEANFFYILAWDNNVIDIREQYNLGDSKETIEIAEMLGYRHPMVPGTSQPNVMTTDFLVTMKNNDKNCYIAYAVKPSIELEKTNVLKKLAIEEVYWKRRGVQFLIVTENSYNKQKAKNIGKFFGKICSMSDDDYPLLSAGSYEMLLSDLIHYQNERISTVCSNIDQKFQYDEGMTLATLFYLVGMKRIEVELEKKFVGTQIIRDVINLESVASEMSLIQEEEQYEHNA